RSLLLERFLQRFLGAPELLRDLAELRCIDLMQTRLLACLLGSAFRDRKLLLERSLLVASPGSSGVRSARLRLLHSSGRYVRMSFSSSNGLYGLARYVVAPASFAF